MKLVWLTDIHLNFLNEIARSNFYSSILKKKPAAILITGDIAEAPVLREILKEMASQIKKPIYFVLGNHDYYRSNVKMVRDALRELMHHDSLLNWLPAAIAVEIKPGTLLVGQDGWADGRFGNYHASPIVLNDSRLIADLFKQQIISKENLLAKMQQLADADAEQLRNNLHQAINQYSPKKIIVLTHVPPFKEVCLYEGNISNDDFLPFFSSKATGDVLLAIAEKYPDINFTVLCGHTHGTAHHQALKNLIIDVGQAEYSYPIIQKVIVV